MSDFRFQPWPETIAIATLFEFCSWLLHYAALIPAVALIRAE